MDRLYTSISTYLDQQHRYPSGLVGRLIGERMVRQHMPETAWTLNQLQIQPQDRVLELGFGAGRGLGHAIKQAHQGYVTGIDLSPTMIDVARRRNAAPLRAGRLGLVRANIAAIPVVEQRFNKIFSIHSYYFWPDPVAILTDLLRALTRDGRIVVTLATARLSAAGEWEYWPIHQQVEALVQKVQQYPRVLSATLRDGPRSRRYNNVAIVIQT